MIVGLFSIIVSIALLALGYIYNRSSRYNYLATRWNDLMNLNADEPNFFSPRETARYQSAFSDEKIKTTYSQYARMYWGFVEDVIRQDCGVDRWLRRESFVAAYRDTIRECINLHHAWMKDNKDRLFTYAKFHSVLKEEFDQELRQVNLEL